MHTVLATLGVVSKLIQGIAFRMLELLGQVFPESEIGCRIRGFIYRPFLKRVGKNFQVALYAKIEHPEGIVVGDNVYVGHGSWLSGLRGGIILADEVMLGPFVTMVSSNHTMENRSFRFGPGVGAEIRVGFGTWIAAGATIIAGTTIGDSCLIAAGAVVNQDIPANSIAAGIPAKAVSATNKQRSN